MHLGVCVFSVSCFTRKKNKCEVYDITGLLTFNLLEFYVRILDIPQGYVLVVFVMAFVKTWTGPDRTKGQFFEKAIKHKKLI